MKNVWNDKKLIEVLKSGGVAVMPTDTIYGLVGSAPNEAVVNRIYEIKNRDKNKPCIVLISDPQDVSKFSVGTTEEQKKIIEKFEGPTSFVLECLDKEFEYLHKGTQSLAFRIPNNQGLKDLLAQSGPLIAPSANPEGSQPARNIEEAKKYFGEKVDYYADGGEMEGKASRLVRFKEDGGFDVLRR